MTQNYRQIVNSIKFFITYDFIYGYIASKETIKSDLKKIDRNKALIILSRLTMLDDKGLEYYKKQLLEMKKTAIDSTDTTRAVPFGSDNLNYTIKWFLAHGVIRGEEAYEITNENVNNVINIVLKVSDYIVGKPKNEEELLKASQLSLLTLKPKGFDIPIYRQSIIFDQIAKEKDLFTDKEFVDIHSNFEAINKYSIQEYVFTIFTLAKESATKISKEELFKSILEKNPEMYYKNLSNKEKILKVCQDIIIEPEQLREWALQSLDNEYDYEKLLSKPFFSINSNIVVSSSGIVENALFDGLFFKINQLFEGNKFFDFYGKLFEQYVFQTLFEAATASKLDYEVIPEFEFGKENKDSSDVYIKFNKSLLIIECKGGKITKNTKINASIKDSKKDFDKYVYCPLEQAYQAYLNIIEEEPTKFADIEEVYIFSVSSHGFPKVSSGNFIVSKEDIAKDHDTVMGVDYISLDELERIAYGIETYEESMFKLIKEKLNNKHYIQYDRFFAEKGYSLQKTKWHTSVFMEVMNNFIKMF